jgi:hypothetical protein
MDARNEKFGLPQIYHDHKQKGHKRAGITVPAWTSTCYLF